MTQEKDGFKEKKLLHEMWATYFNLIVENGVQEDTQIDPEHLRMFWQEMGYLGTEDLIDHEGFVKTGFLDEALDYLARYGQEAGREKTQQDLQLLIEYLGGQWEAQTQKALPSDATIFEAGEPDIDGSVSTE